MKNINRLVQDIINESLFDHARQDVTVLQHPDVVNVKGDLGITPLRYAAYDFKEALQHTYA